VIARASGVLLSLLTATVLDAQQLASSPRASSVPRVIPVTGVFVPSNGEPAARVETVTLAIYTEQASGSAVWEETQRVAVDEKGRYSLLLGATSADGIPAAVFASGAEWLGIRFERAGEVEGPRVRLTSVPYALRASDADTLGGRPASDYLVAPSAGTTAPAATSSQKSMAAPAGELPGTPNAVAKYVDTSNVGPSTIFENGGFVGVGTTAPIDNLHVRFANTTGSLTGFAVQNMGNTSTSYSGMLFYDQNGALGQFQGFNNATHEYRINNIASGGSINFMLNSSSKFQVRPDGDVDIPGSIRNGGARFLYSFGVGNTFLGLNTGNVTMTGINNTGIGFEVLQINTTGGANTAIGERALVSNTTGNYNAATGYHALDANTGGSHNTAIGAQAMSQNFGGDGNTAVGDSAMLLNSTGNNNVAIGYFSGVTVNPGSNNIYLGSNVSGVHGESNAMYLGLQGTQTKTVIAGIRGIATGVGDAINVFIDSNGQLGTINSSRRYTQDIQDMGEISSGLIDLRPVIYRYQQPYANGTKPIDYGLIAEEVEEVYPDLVTHMANGDVETVQYQKINAMLLNEVQKQHRAIEDLKARLATIERLLATEKKSKE
jgi:hypothetical protein